MKLCLKMGKDLRNGRILEVLQRPAFRETKANIIRLKQGQHCNGGEIVGSFSFAPLQFKMFYHEFGLLYNQEKTVVGHRWREHEETGEGIGNREAVG